MAQRRFHYDVAFENYLRERTIPYIAVDEAKRSLATTHPPTTLKSFDFVVYNSRGSNLLVDVKGRKHSCRSGRSLDNWVTESDVSSMRRWEKLFGEGFEAVFAFLYWCAVEPPDALFQDVFASGERWYAVLAVRLSDYEKHMKPRSARWETVSLPAAHYHRVAIPLNQMLAGVRPEPDQPGLF